MHKYSYSYKSDSTNEIIGYVFSDNEDDAIIRVSDIKKLSVHQVEELFNIKRVDI